MASLKVKWTSRGIFPEGFVPPTRFVTDSKTKKYHSPVKCKDGSFDVLMFDCIENREYIDSAVTWDIIEEDVIVKRAKKIVPTQTKEPLSRTQMQSAMDEANYDYGSGAVISDAKMKQEYRNSAPKRSKEKKKKEAYESKIRNGGFQEQEV